MTIVPPFSDLASEWAEARLLYPVYSALAKEFVIDIPGCPDLETGADTPPAESVTQARHWLREVDDRIQVHQLRRFLQTSTLATEESLKTLLLHYLRKEKKTNIDRDKVDFLLVQYFSHCAPSQLEESDVDLEYVAQVLEPILRQADLTVPDWLKPVDQVMQAARRCRGLSELLHSGILEQGRKAKVQCGDKYFVPVAMVAFARFSFLMRRVFFHLMHADLNAILDGLRELENRGVTTLDCRRAQFSADEPIARLRMICQSWKVMFHAEYSSGQPLRMLVDLRASIAAALEQGTPTTTRGTTVPGRAAVAVAGAGSSRSRDKAKAAEAPAEFEVSPHSEWDGPHSSQSSRNKDNG
jgi:hypothetical protein